jgi:hypothetical protein
MLDPLKRFRRKRLRKRPFPRAFRAVLERNFALYGRLPEADRGELERLIQVFMAEKRFEGCGGLEVTDEIRVVIAAQACLLLLHRDTDVYPRLVTILVYPSAYVARVTERVGYGVVAEGEMGRLGEAWQTGVVVLSWDHAQAGAADVHDGRNVTLHEFAHQLDQEDGASDGAPVLPRRSMYVAWARVLGDEYAALRRDAESGAPTLLNPYGATNPAEFFAVATETFFQMPGALKRRHPALYGELQRFYRQDPLSWSSEDTA